MAAGFALARTTVTTDGHEYKGVRATVRRNRLIVTNRVTGEIYVNDETVSSVVRLTSKQWQVSTANAVYDIKREGGCSSCGR